MPTRSNLALSSPDGDRPPPLELFTRGWHSRKRIREELAAFSLPGTVILVHRKQGGSKLAVHGRWPVVRSMLGDQMIAFDPWTGRTLKVKACRPLPMVDGNNFDDYCGTNWLVCKGGISKGCQAWKEAAWVAAGMLEVPRLRAGCRATQVPTEDEVQVVATAVGAEESRSTLGKRGQGGEKRQGGGNATGRKKKPKTQQRGGGRSDGGQRSQATEVRRVEGQGDRGARNKGGEAQGSATREGCWTTDRRRVGVAADTARHWRCETTCCQA